MIRAMRRVLRWMLFLSLVVGAAWVSASVEIAGKTPFGHARAWWKKQDFARELRTWLDFGEEKPKTPKKPKPKPKEREAERAPAPAPVEREATARRVAMLEKAAAAIERDEGNPGKPVARTTVGEKPSAEDKKALDELVSSRVPRKR